MLIVFDIGGTKMRFGSSRDGESLDKTIIIETPEQYEVGLEKMKRALDILSDGEPISAMSGGIAGPYSQKKLTLVGGPNMKDWVGRPIKSDLETTFNAPVFIENDAAMGGLGEAVRGAGRGYEIVAYLTISTGVGGSRIVNQKIDAKSIGFEPGHQIVDGDQTIFPEGTGILLGEDYISGKALSARTGKKPKDVTEPNVWIGLARILSFAINNIYVFWSPDVIVLGGSMITGNPAISIDKTMEFFNKIPQIYEDPPVVKMSELGDYVGLYGALEYAKLKIRNT